MSSAIAISIFLRVSALARSSRDSISSEEDILLKSLCSAIISAWVSLVTLSTKVATSLPKSFTNSEYEISQSSITSCKSAADKVLASNLKSARNIAVCLGCSKKDSPESLIWPLWAFLAYAYALDTSSTLSGGK